MSDVPDPRLLAREELTTLLRELTTREHVVSDERQALHGQIDAIRADLVNRVRDEDEDEDEDVIAGSDFLDPGSAGVREPRSPRPHAGADGIALPRPAPDHQPDPPGPQQPPAA